MKAMLLAAGRGERMGGLTQTCPKPLLPVAGKPLLLHHLERLMAAGFDEVVVNASYLGDQIEQFLQQLDIPMTIHLSREPERLETGGGIYNALPLLGNDPFLVVNSDVWTDYPLTQACREPLRFDRLAHMVMVTNPPHNPSGDFSIDRNGLLHNIDEPGLQLDSQESLTFSGISVLSPLLFQSSEAGRFPLAPLLRQAAARQLASAEKYTGCWIDVGTPERLELVEQNLQERSR